jgi:hypothetical protein
MPTCRLELLQTWWLTGHQATLACRRHGPKGCAGRGARRGFLIALVRLSGSRQSRSFADSAFLRRSAASSLRILGPEELAATLEAAKRAQRSRPLLHPEMGKLYRDWVIEARDGLNDADRRADATAALRGMVEEILFTPDGETLAIVLKGDLAAMLAAASPKAEASDMRRQVTLVAGGCSRRDLASWWTAA